MRVAITIAVLLVVTSCSSGGNGTDAKTNARMDRCTERFLDRIQSDRGAMIRRYVERTYCGPFARKGWVYADGTLSIKAHLYLLNGGSCSTSTPGGPTTTVPCEPMLDPLDCAILHYVRRDEVRAYIRTLKRSHKVSCDDGTPLDKLGAI